MYVYRVTFGQGNTADVRANSPKEAYENATKFYGLNVTHVKYLRGK